MLFCRTLLDYASNEPKVREAIRELETMFPPQKAEEGLSQHFLPQEEQKKNLNFNDDDNTNGTGGKDDKKNKAKKRVNTKKEGGPAQMKGGADRGNPNLNHGADKSR